MTLPIWSVVHEDCHGTREQEFDLKISLKSMNIRSASGITLFTLGPGNKRLRLFFNYISMAGLPRWMLGEASKLLPPLSVM